jgi:hypothetical protein
MEKPDRSKLPIRKRALHDPEPEPEPVSPEEGARIMHALARNARAFMGEEAGDAADPELSRRIIRVVQRPG